jgi:hypothetical protein
MSSSGPITDRCAARQQLPFRWLLVFAPIAYPKLFKRAFFGLIRRDGYVAWAGERTLEGLRDLLVRWFGPPAVAWRNM